MAILTQLQSKRIVTAQELATRFSVSIRTIYRDIKTLEQAGIPIYGDPGKGFSVMEGYRLPPIMFTDEEAISLATTEKIIGQYLDQSLIQSYQSALFKIKAVLKYVDKEKIDILDSQVKSFNHNTIFQDQLPHALTDILQAIIHKKQVSITYQSSTNHHTETRIIEPIGIYHEYNYWYVYAYCLLRQDFRKFRSDRIVAMSKTEQVFTKTYQPLDFYLKDEKPKEWKYVQTIWQVPKTIVKYLNYDKKMYGFQNEKIDGNNVIMTFLLPEEYIPFMIRWYTMFADEVTILEPSSLIDAAQQYINHIHAKHWDKA